MAFEGGNVYTLEIKHENGNGHEFGYGIYVNAYIIWDDEGSDVPVRYASECVPFGQNTPVNIAAAEERVRAEAHATAKREYMGGSY